jgi:hydroxymethylpyrimidine/phosphomethylpyrimidine kinase
MQAPRLLVVAGHDPSGAGIDADRDAAAELSCDVLAVVTAHTDQDDRGVRSIGAVPPRAWLAEALALLDERSGAPIGAIKTGLLPGAEHVRAALELVQAARAQLGPQLPIVVDPVIAASSGTRFLDAAAVRALARELGAADVVLTPNLSEAAELVEAGRVDAQERAVDAHGGEPGAAGRPASAAPSTASLDGRVAAARLLVLRGARAVVLKGGHGDEDPVLDLVLERAGEPVPLAHARLPGATLRGSGCRFATFLACGLARGLPLDAAARDAGLRVARRLAGGSGPGRG